MKKTPIDALLDYSAEEVAEFHPHMLCIAMKEAEAEYKRVMLLKEWIDRALHLRYGDHAAALRRAQKIETGVITFYDHNFIVTQDIPKLVEWNQELLVKAACKLLADKENPADFMHITYAVLEKKYAALPFDVRDILEPARIIQQGAPVFTLNEKEAKDSIEVSGEYHG